MSARATAANCGAMAWLYWPRKRPASGPIQVTLATSAAQHRGGALEPGGLGLKCSCEPIELFNVGAQLGHLPLLSVERVRHGASRREPTIRSIRGPSSAAAEAGIVPTAVTMLATCSPAGT